MHWILTNILIHSGKISAVILIMMMSAAGTEDTLLRSTTRNYPKRKTNPIRLANRPPDRKGNKRFDESE